MDDLLRNVDRLLTEPETKIFKMHFLGFTFKEIGDQYDIPKKELGEQWDKIKDKFRNRLLFLEPKGKKPESVVVESIKPKRSKKGA